MSINLPSKARLSAEAQGFEPRLGSHLKQFSRLPHSTALPNLRNIDPTGLDGGIGFEPISCESESHVLPLDEPSVNTDDRGFYFTASPCLTIRQVTRHAKVTADFITRGFVSQCIFK